jgi:hypothetical protein
MFPFDYIFNNDKSEEEARKRYFQFMKSPDAYEKEVFILRIKELETCLEESRKLYNQTRESDYDLRSATLREIESLEITLAMSKNEYQLWKQHRVTISK